MFLNAQFHAEGIRAEQSRALLLLTRDRCNQELVAIFILFSVQCNSLYAVFYRHITKFLSMFNGTANGNKKMCILQRAPGRENSIVYGNVCSIFVWLFLIWSQNIYEFLPFWFLCRSVLFKLCLYLIINRPDISSRISSKGKSILPCLVQFQVKCYITR